jgi:hypothetical protein
VESGLCTTSPPQLIGSTTGCVGMWFPGPLRANVNPARDRRVGLSAIGQCLTDQYDALAPPVPPHLAALVEQLETQERG